MTPKTPEVKRGDTFTPIFLTKQKNTTVTYNLCELAKTAVFFVLLFSV